MTPWISRVSKHEFPRLTKSILYIHGFCAFEQKSFQKCNTYSLLTQLNGVSCFKGIESDPGNCCLLIPWEGAQVGLEEFQEVASLPRCLLTKEQMEVWDCRSGGNLMCQDRVFLYRGNTDLGIPFQTHPSSQASSGVWRVDLGLLSRSCRKRRPSSYDDGPCPVLTVAF